MQTQSLKINIFAFVADFVNKYVDLVFHTLNLLVPFICYGGQIWLKIKKNSYRIKYLERKNLTIVILKQPSIYVFPPS